MFFDFCWTRILNSLVRFLDATETQQQSRLELKGLQTVLFLTHHKSAPKRKMQRMSPKTDTKEGTGSRHDPHPDTKDGT